MSGFNVIVEDNGKFVPYNIIPYLVKRYNEADNKPESYDEFKEFVENESMYQWWSRCEYEIILMDWPGQSKAEKWDVHKQVMMNLDIITNTLITDILVNSDEKR